VRSLSKGHIGIPLASEHFVSSIPMISALLEQLGFDLGWLRGDAAIVTKKMGRVSGLFYINDASTARDSRNRPIIAAQDFVRDHGIRSVFGMGGGYITSPKFFTTICFTTESLASDQVTPFQALCSIFKIHTMKMIDDQRRYFK